VSQDLPAQLAENPAASHSGTLAALARMLDYAAPGRFVLAFAKCNTPLQRSKLVDELKVLLEPLNIALLEVELKEPVEKLLPLLQEKLAGSYLAPIGTFQLKSPALVHESQPKPAFFVYGLEHSIPSSDPNPAIFSHLNLARELFRESVPCPLVIWLPDYALTLLARGAPDLWAWRSGVYEFAAEVEVVESAIRQVVHSGRGYETNNLSVEAKRDRLYMLARLLEDYKELGEGAHERDAQARILATMGAIHENLGDLNEARIHYEEALDLERTISHQPAIASLLGDLARLAHVKGNIVESRHLYEKSLQLERELGDKASIAGTLLNLGTLALDGGDIAEALRLYNENLQLFSELNDKYGVAVALHQLGMVAQFRGDLNEAHRLYDESLQQKYELGDKQGIAATLHQLGKLAQNRGDLSEAHRLYNESLQINREVGNKLGIANTLGQQALLNVQEGDLDAALLHIQESERMFNELESPKSNTVKQIKYAVEEALAKQADDLSSENNQTTRTGN